MLLRVCDVETSGMDPAEGAQVCELGFVNVMQDDTGDWFVIENIYSSLHAVSRMPPEVRAVHHITMSDLDKCEPFGNEDVEILCGMADALVAHNDQFERRFIMQNVIPWICTYKVSLRVWPDAPGHSNSVLKCWLEDQGLLKLDHEKAMPPHRAGPDAYVTAHILLALLKVATVEEMIEWTKEPRLLPRCPIGKFKGKPWAEVEWGFLRWMLQQESMEEDLKWNARREMDRRLAEN